MSQRKTCFRLLSMGVALVLFGGADRFQTPAIAQPLAPAKEVKLTEEQKARLAEVEKLVEQALKLQADGKTSQAIPLIKQVLAINKEVLGEKHHETATSLFYLGYLLREIRDYAAARPYAEQALAIRKEILGEKHLHTALSLNELGLLLCGMGDYAAAQPYLEQALAIRKEILGENDPYTAQSLNNLGYLLKTTGDYAAARPYYEQALAIDKEVLGEKHHETGTSLNNLGDLLIAMKDYPAARPYYEQALAINKEVLGEKHPDTAHLLNNLGYLLQEMKDYPAAQRYYEQALAIRKEVLGEMHPDTATSLNNLGDLCREIRDYPAARPYYEKALAIREEVLGKKHPNTAHSLNNLGNLLQEMKEYAAARPYYEQALAVRKEVLGEKHPDTASSLNSLGLLLDEMGEYPEARRYLEQALAINKEVLGEKHPDTATALNNVGDLLIAMGDYSAARSYYEQTLAIRKEVLGEKHPDTALSLNNLGFFLNTIGDYSAARPYYEKALAINKEVLGEKHPNTAGSLNNLGNFLIEMGDYAAAKPYYEQALAIHKEVFGERHPNTALSLNNLGLLLEKMGDNAAARPYLEQALAIHREVFGERHPNTALLLNNLGLLLEKMGDNAAARPYLEQALATNKRVLGEKHPQTALSLNNLGYLLQETGDNAAALRCYEQALAINKEVLGETHPDTALSFENLGFLLVNSGEWELAARNFDESRRVVRRYVSRALPTLSLKEQMAFLDRNDVELFQAAVSLGWMRQADFGMPGNSAGWVINGKAVAHEALVERERLAHDSQDPVVAAAARQLVDLRRQLAGLTLSTPKMERAAARLKQLAELERQDDEISRRIAHAHGEAFQADPWVEIASVRQAIPTHAVFVEIVRFGVRNFQAKGREEAWQPAHYMAWVIPAEGAGEIQIIDLGEAGPIEHAIQTARTQLANPSNQATLPAALARLTELIWQPLQPALGEVKQVILSPDGALWMVPWEALSTGEGRYLIEDYRLRYVNSGRDLVRQPRTKRDETAPVIFANPNFDLSPNDVATATQEIFKTKSATNSFAVRGVDASRDSTKVNRLPGTKVEAEAIKPRLAKLCGKEPLVYTDRYALEGVFKALHRPQVVVLSTHGFFMPDQQVKRPERELMMGENRGAVLTVDGKLYENPLLRCGLLLAGCNQPSQAGTADDGVLTGMEILGTDLRGTQLVVLSACETALGDVRNGEGVAGLRQAFQLAGAQAVISTLWKIPDQETAWLMTRFWENVAAGMNKADALRDAQLMMLYHRDELRALAAKGKPADVSAMLATRGVDFSNPRPLPNGGKAVSSATGEKPSTSANKSGKAHPYYWAAFTITGQTDVATAKNQSK